MRKNTIAGLALAMTATSLVILGSVLDLDLQAVTLLGAALGAALALVADRSAGARLVAFAGGVAMTWAGYLVRAQFLPDTETGRAVFAGLVVLLVVGLVVVTRERLPLWAALLGAGAFAGAFEAAYAAAPPEVMANSVSAATPLLFTVGAGFLVASLVTPPAAVPAQQPVADRALAEAAR